MNLRREIVYSEEGVQITRIGNWLHTVNLVTGERLWTWDPVNILSDRTGPAISSLDAIEQFLELTEGM
jgi:hypothetical protein